MNIFTTFNTVYKFILAGGLVFLIISCGQQSNKETDKEEDNGILMATFTRPLTDVKYESTPERLARGEYLADALWCVACHTECDTTKAGWPPIMEKRLSGSLRYKRDSTYLYAPNLTSDKETGIGNFTDDMIGRAIREGYGHDGRSIVPAGGGGMPWPNYRNFTDEDLASIVVYLRSVPAIKNKIPKRKIGIREEKRIQGRAYPLAKDSNEPDFSDLVSRGKYLISLGDCAGCHRGTAKSTGFLGGGHNFPSGNKIITSPNLTSDETGIGSWSEETFISVMRNGMGKSGQLSHAMPWIAYRNFSDEDLGAIYHALMKTYPIKHLVLNNGTPSYCEVCGKDHGLGNANHLETLKPFRKDYRIPKDLAGLYCNQRFNTDTLRIIYKNDSLFSRRNANPNEWVLIPIEEDRYIGKESHITLAFIRNSTDNVSEVKFGEINTYKRIE